MYNKYDLPDECDLLRLLNGDVSSVDKLIRHYDHYLHTLVLDRALASGVPLMCTEDIEQDIRIAEWRAMLHFISNEIIE